MNAAVTEVADNLRLFVKPGQVTELRALDVTEDGRWPATVAGWFDHAHLDDMAAEAVRLQRHAVGVYFVPNPIIPAILARCGNKVKQVKDAKLTKDAEIERRHWLLIDADPIRPDGISSTDEEKAAAWEMIQGVKEWMWAHYDHTEPVLADSGNGYHLLYPVDWPASATEKAKAVLHEVADKWDNPQVKIDRKVFNAARIVKLYGTASRKGDSTPERPHRQSKVIR